MNRIMLNEFKNGNYVFIAKRSNEILKVYISYLDDEIATASNLVLCDKEFNINMEKTDRDLNTKLTYKDLFKNGDCYKIDKGYDIENLKEDVPEYFL